MVFSFPVISITCWLTGSRPEKGSSSSTTCLSCTSTRAKAARILTSPVEHDAVLRVTAGADRLPVDADGRVCARIEGGGTILAIQHVNNETGVIQPLDRIERGR